MSGLIVGKFVVKVGEVGEDGANTLLEVGRKVCGCFANVGISIGDVGINVGDFEALVNPAN